MYNKRHLSISAISQLLLPRLGSNFKQRVLGTYTIDNNCLLDICPVDICSYQSAVAMFNVRLTILIVLLFFAGVGANMPADGNWIYKGVRFISSAMRAL